MSRLNRDEAHLDSMLRNLAVSLILYEKVKTTQAKAIAIKPVIERLIVNAKKQTLPVAMRALNAYLPDKNASKKLTQELLKRYEKRQSGFVRIIPLGNRPGDAAPVVQIEFV
jgi:large subunit ribosomal protein L17